MRIEAFGANRLDERKEVSFGELVLEALEVGLAEPFASSARIAARLAACAASTPLPAVGNVVQNKTRHGMAWQTR